MKLIKFAFLLLLVPFIISAENLYLNDWKSYSSFSEITKLVQDANSNIWSASYGGISVYDIKSHTYKYLSNEDGLLSVQISALASDGTIIIAGTYDGIIEIFDGKMNCVNLSDIKRANFTNPKINDIKIHSGKAYIAGGFGIAVLDIEKQIFTETITKIGTFTRNVEVNSVLIYNDSLWAGTKEGLAFAQLNSSLQNPSSWESKGRKDGLNDNSTNISHLIEFKGEIHFSADTIAGKYSNDSLKIIRINEKWMPIRKFFIYDNRLLEVSAFYIRDLYSDLSYRIQPSDYGGEFTEINTADVFSFEGKDYFAVAFKEIGLGIFDFDTLEIYPVNSPLIRSFHRMEVDSKGRLWAVSGIDNSKGLSLFEDGNWTSIYSLNHKELTTNSLFTVFVDSKEKVYTGSWGHGYFVFDYQNNKFNISNYNTTNSPLTGMPQSPLWAIAGGIKEDRDGNIWILNAFGSPTTPLLLKYKPDNTFETFIGNDDINIKSPIYLELDNAETKWIGSGEGSGIIYYNEKSNISGKLTTGNSQLTSNTINCMAMDKLGALWIGTSDGMSVIINPSAVLSKSNLFIRKVTFVSGKVITALHIDAVNNKWVGTNDGVWVISPDGTEVLKIIDTKNSPLTSNEIKSITSDKNSGRVYISTSNGLFSVNTLSVEPAQEYDIISYPQPFNLKKDTEVVIEGLKEKSTLKIVTTDGEYIATIQVNGSRAVWDGTNSKGQKVSNGVYLLLASNEDDKAVGKIAVINN